MKTIENGILSPQMERLLEDTIVSFQVNSASQVVAGWGIPVISVIFGEWCLWNFQW